MPEQQREEQRDARGLAPVDQRERPAKPHAARDKGVVRLRRIQPVVGEVGDPVLPESAEVRQDPQQREDRESPERGPANPSREGKTRPLHRRSLCPEQAECISDRRSRARPTDR